MNFQNRASRIEQHGDLQEAQYVLENLLDSSADAIGVADSKGRCVSWNRAAAEIFGYSAADLEGKHFSELYADPAELEIMLARLRRDGFVRQYEINMKKKDGTSAPFDLSINLLYDRQRNLTGSLCIARDRSDSRRALAALQMLNERLENEISKRKKMEGAWRETLETLSALLNAIPESIFLISAGGVIVTANETAAKRLGKDLDDLIGSELSKLLPPEIIKRRKAYTDEARRTGRSVHFEDMRDGRVLDNIIRPIINPEGKVSKLAVFSIDITAHKEAEESIKENIRLRQQILDTIPSPIFYKGIDGRYLGVNQSFLQFYGKTMEQVLGKTVHEVFCKEIADKYFQLNQHHWQHPGPQIYEYYTYDAQGRRREIVAHNATFNDKNGALVGLAGVMIDSTEQLQSEQVIKSLLNQTKLILDSAAEGILGLDIERKHIFVNPAATRMLGYGEGELIGFGSHATWHRLRPDGTPYPQEECQFRKNLKSGVAYSAEDVFWRKDGSSFPVELKSSPISEDGKNIGTVITFWDITERQQAEAALREKEEKYRGLIETTNTGYVIVDSEGKVLDANAEYVRLTGHIALKEILGRSILEWTAQQDRGENAAALEQCRKTGSVKHLELNYGIDGRFIAVEINATAIRTSEGIKFIALARDISDRKKVEDERAKLEAQLVQAQKMEAIGTLAGGIAHDFNNILTAILGNIGLGLLDQNLGGQGRQRLAAAEKACQQAQSLARQLLTFAKGGAPITELVSLENLVAEAASLACRGSQVRCESAFGKDLMAVTGDPGQLHQVFQNLIINAVQAMPGGGSVRIHGENVEIGEKSDSPLTAGKYVKISIQDNGVGIPEKYLQKIFDPYFTTKQQGSGLGLATTYSIVNNHHGHIAVESRLGEGTTFQVYLPASDQKYVPPPQETTELLSGQGKILVMDDEAMVREVLGMMLLTLGYEVEFARDGVEASQMFSQAHGAAEPFAAVILDLTVPGGMGGKEAMERLVKIDPQVKAIVSSGYFADPIMADFQKYGFAGVIAKPYKVAELGKALNKALKGNE